MTILIPNAHARRHLMALQGLARPPHLALRKAELAAKIARMGFVQVDSVNVVERAHHHILFSRSQSYRRADLARLVEKERTLFENWTHDAAIIPVEFFPYWRHRFEREKKRLPGRWRQFAGEGFHAEADRVLERIAREGPLMARDFEGERARTGWWDWHPAKAALEFLWRTGDLAIARRHGFQKVYDLAERVIPAPHAQARVDEEAFRDWACRAALSRLGFATRGEIAAFFALLTPQEVGEWIAENRAELESVLVESADGSPPRAAFALPGGVEACATAPEPPERVRVLSPFDPLLRDRKRTERIFGFHYRIEIFVPEARRRYGYYVFPVMRGDRIVGRIDMKAERDADRLAVGAFWPEPGVRVSARFLQLLEAELWRIARFSGVRGVDYAPGWRRS